VRCIFFGKAAVPCKHQVDAMLRSARYARKQLSNILTPRRGGALRRAAFALEMVESGNDIGRHSKGQASGCALISGVRWRHVDTVLAPEIVYLHIPAEWRSKYERVLIAGQDFRASTEQTLKEMANGGRRIITGKLLASDRDQP
jgi:hypothetical protein